jgi:deaminated glutathione amidase
VLLRARAIENQAFVIASAQGGTHENGRRTWGHSMVIDPWGEVHGPAGQTDPAWSWPTSTSTACAAVREQLPALQHRRL